MLKSAMDEFKEYFDKNCAPRLAEIRKVPQVWGYQIWTRGFVPNTDPRIETPVIRDSRIYLNKEAADKAREQFADETYLVEYPVTP